MSSFDTDRGVIILETAQWAVLQRMRTPTPSSPRTAPPRPFRCDPCWGPRSGPRSAAGCGRIRRQPVARGAPSRLSARPGNGGGVTMLGDEGRASPPARPAAHRWTGEHAHIAPMTGSVHPSGHD